MIKGKLRQVVVVLGIMAVFGTASAYAQPTFVNGSFENDNWAPGLVSHVTPSGWNAVQSSDSRFVRGVHNTGSTSSNYTPYGNQFIELCGGDCINGIFGNVSQTVSGFTVGHQYTLSFAHSPEGSNENDLVEVTIGGAGTLSQVFSSAGTGGSWSQWKNHTWTFTADSASLTFTFAGAFAGGSNYESGIDNISLSSAAGIPTLSEWALFVLAILLGGAVFTRRKQLS